MPVVTTKDVRIAFATEAGEYGKLCLIIGTVTQAVGTDNDYNGKTFTVVYNGTTYTVTGVGDNLADCTAVVAMLNTAFITAGCQEKIKAVVSGNYVKLYIAAGVVLADGTGTPLASRLGIPAGNYPNRAFCSNVIISTADCSSGLAITGKTLTINGTTVTFDSNPGTQAATVIEIQDALTAAGITTVTVAASGTLYLAFTLTNNISINAVAATTSLALIGLTAGFYGYWTAINIPNSVKLANKEYLRDRIHPAGAAVNDTQVITKGIKYKDFELKTYIQTVFWMTDAIASTASFTFHTEYPGDAGAYIYRDIIGSRQSKISIETGKDDCFQTNSYSWLDDMTTAAYTGIPNFPATTVLATKEFPNHTITVDGDDIAPYLETSTLTITNTLVDHTGANTFLRTEPAIIARDAELKMDANDDPANQLVLLSTLSPTPITIVFGFGTAFRISITNMLPDESNKGEVPEKLDTQKHSVTLKNSGVCVYSIT